MTERLGRRARWTTALVVAPGAAAVFGASVAWAAHVVPATAAKPAPVRIVAAPKPAASVRITTLRRELDAHRRHTADMQRELVALEHRLTKLRAARAGLEAAAKAGAAASTTWTGGTSGVSNSGSGNYGSSGTTTSGGTQQQAAPPAAAPPAAAPPAAAPPPPPPPPPPPVVTTTKASG